jgi:hypothetical protein
MPGSSLAHDNDSHPWLTSFGLALILVGQPIAWFVRGQLTDGESPVFPAAIVLIGFLMVLGNRPFRNPRLQVDPAILAIFVLLVLLPIVALAMVAPVELLTDWTYSLFTIAVLAALAITPLSSLRHLPLAVALVGGVSSALPIYELATSSALENFVRLTLRGNNNTLVVGTVGGMTMLSATWAIVTGGARSLATGFLCAVAFVAGLAGVALSNTRSVMIALLYSLPILLLVLRPLARGTFQPVPPSVARAQRFVFLVATGLAALSAPAVLSSVVDTETLESVLEAFADRIAGAFSALSGDEFGSVDRSSAERIELIASTMNGLTFWGEGINSQLLEQGNRRDRGVYPHLTYLQAFYDLGLPGAIIFTLTNLAIPLALISRRLLDSRIDPAIGLFIIYYLFSHMDQLTHGTPYFWYITLPVGLVYAMVPRPLPGRPAGVGTG